MKSEPLDRFYTKPEVAKHCLDDVRYVMAENRLSHYPMIEPSAGNGSFFKLMPNGTIGIDLDPQLAGIKEGDFLEYEHSDSHNMIAVGNPPFGNRASLAIKFFNKCAEFCDMIAFIVPVQFKKWGVQSKLDKDFDLYSDETLDPKSFILNNEPYSVRCCFQIWIRKEFNSSGRNIRILEKPPISHEDFQMWQYNNTKEAEKVFKEDFDFAVPRQGYQDYSRREADQKNCERNKQWILFKAKNEIVRKKLNSIDFEKLAKRNTTTPGFGKADVVDVYVNGE